MAESVDGLLGPINVERLANSLAGAPDGKELVRIQAIDTLSRAIRIPCIAYAADCTPLSFMAIHTCLQQREFYRTVLTNSVRGTPKSPQELLEWLHIPAAKIYHPEATIEAVACIAALGRRHTDKAAAMKRRLSSIQSKRAADAAAVATTTTTNDNTKDSSVTSAISRLVTRLLTRYITWRCCAIPQRWRLGEALFRTLKQTHVALLQDIFPTKSVHAAPASSLCDIYWEIDLMDRLQDYVDPTLIPALGAYAHAIRNTHLLLNAQSRRNVAPLTVSFLSNYQVLHQQLPRKRAAASTAAATTSQVLNVALGSNNVAGPTPPLVFPPPPANPTDNPASIPTVATIVTGSTTAAATTATTTKNTTPHQQLYPMRSITEDQRTRIQGVLQCMKDAFHRDWVHSGDGWAAVVGCKKLRAYFLEEMGPQAVKAGKLASVDVTLIRRNKVWNTFLCEEGITRGRNRGLRIRRVNHASIATSIQSESPAAITAAAALTTLQALVEDVEKHFNGDTDTTALPMDTQRIASLKRALDDCIAIENTPSAKRLRKATL